MTIEKLRFKHKCIENEKEIDNSNKPQVKLSAFEIFKSTPQYLEIMKKLGKTPAIKNEIPNNQSCEN